MRTLAKLSMLLAVLVGGSAATVAHAAAHADLAAGARPGHSVSLPVAAPSHLPTVQRVLWLGDSLGASVESDLTEAFGAAGVAFAYAGFPGTGPLTAQGRFWQEELSRMLETFDPDLVIFQASGNYNIGGGDPYLSEDGEMVDHGTPEFFAVWERSVLALVVRAQEHGAATMIVTAPVAAPAADSHPFTAEHNAGHAQVARKRGATLLDWNRFLAPSGQFQATVQVDEVEVALRAADGLHFAATGQPLISNWIVAQVLSRVAASTQSA